MSTPDSTTRFSALLGTVEPHAPLLRMPPDDQLLYKVMTVENLVRSIGDRYIHFNRVDSYSDFANADQNDGRQLPADQPINAATRFQTDPSYSASDFYDLCRRRTYACCFSVENSDYIWENYGNGSEKGKVCVIFEFRKLRAMLNSAMAQEGTVLLHEGNPCRQIFSVNYGLVNYVPWGTHRTNEEYLSNPILYTYIKDDQFEEDKELRISLSAIGIGQFALANGTLVEFPSSIRFGFNFRNAIDDLTIRQVLLAPEADSGFLKRELSQLGIQLAPTL